MVGELADYIDGEIFDQICELVPPDKRDGDAFKEALGEVVEKALRFYLKSRRDMDLEEEITNYLRDEITMLPRNATLMAKEIMDIIDCHGVLAASK